MGQEAEKQNKTERVTGPGRRTRGEIVKWNQMTAVWFQTGWRHQTDIPGLPSGALDVGSSSDNCLDRESGSVLHKWQKTKQTTTPQKNKPATLTDPNAHVCVDKLHSVFSIAFQKKNLLVVPATHNCERKSVVTGYVLFINLKFNSKDWLLDLLLETVNCLSTTAF